MINTATAIGAARHVCNTPGDWIRLALAALEEAGVDEATRACVQDLVVDSVYTRNQEMAVTR
jgi:hypothetical protein